MSMQIDDCEPGDHPVVKVSLDDNLSGNLTIRCSDFSKNYTLPISGGSGEYELDENLAPGSYLCTVGYGGDYSHNSVIRSKFFLVNKYDPALDISASHNARNQKATVKIKANESINGDVEVELKEEKTGMTVNTAKVELVNGAGTVSFDDGLVPGNYTATVNFAGDDTFQSCEKSISFTADKFQPI